VAIRFSRNSRRFSNDRPSSRIEEAKLLFQTNFGEKQLENQQSGKRGDLLIFKTNLRIPVEF
jgi:hypothetical protein